MISTVERETVAGSCFCGAITYEIDLPTLLIPEAQGLRAVLLAAVPPPQDDPDRSLVDADNPDPSLRQRPLANLELGRLEPAGDDRW